MPSTETNNKHLRIALGGDNFKEMATESDVFVDKTLFIKEVIDSGEKAMLITYPRRWGKTLNLDMLKTFFEPESKECEERKEVESVLNEIESREVTRKWLNEEISASANYPNAPLYPWYQYQKRITECDNIWSITYWGKLYWCTKEVLISLCRKCVEGLYNYDYYIERINSIPSPPDLEKLKANCNKYIFSGGNFTIKKGDKNVVKKLPPLKITDAKDAEGNSYIDSYQGKYPVIFITLKDVVGDTYDSVKAKLGEYISTLFVDYEYLLESPVISSLQKEKFNECLRQNFSQFSLESSMNFLSKLLYEHHKQRVYVLVDEYDKPVNHILEKDIFAEDRTLIQDLTELVTNILSTLSTCGKGNDHLEKIILTGIFDTVKKEGNSGFNNVKVFGISDQNFSENFGFSEAEVEKLVGQFNFQIPINILNNIKAWYNGYTVPISLDTGIQKYTPWAVMSYLNDINNPHKGENYPPQNYWTQSGYSKILEDLLRKEVCIESDLSKKLRDIVEGNAIQLKFDSKLSLYKHYIGHRGDTEEVFSYLLLNSGYLTVDQQKGIPFFKVPNSEVHSEFKKVIRDQKDVNCENHKQILANIRKKEHVDVLEAIKKQDIAKLKGIFEQNSAIKCSDSNLNFNYLHISALIGNKEIFSLLYSVIVIRICYIKKM